MGTSLGLPTETEQPTPTANLEVGTAQSVPREMEKPTQAASSEVGTAQGISGDTEKLATTPFASFEVQTLSDMKRIDVFGDRLRDLRSSIKEQFGIPGFEQKVLYQVDADAGNCIELVGDDSVLLKEKVGLLDAKMLMLARQVDPRYKMEKETAFLDALLATRFSDAKDILESSGATIDPNCVHRKTVYGAPRVSEVPFLISHPALTVAIQAGLEKVIAFGGARGERMKAFMDRENEVSEVVELLILKKADVNAVGEETQDCESAGCVLVRGKSPLCAAVQRGSPALVRMLLDANADPTHRHNHTLSAWGPDHRNPLGSGVLEPKSWLGEVCNGSVSSRSATDPRNANTDEILRLLSS
eukprot:TRINITY_DN21805_c0_g1_i1.p1 TRINITY_DN21805_c0_g1~~TRINITY_DN21805_c0_g1_i1.p1  ORF type:complete len:358 (+),score=50.73 TRINITY_DN21805_c0_g1_i1:112-1185(+)